MAILTDFPGLRVEVHVNGAACKEYDDDEDPPPKTVTKYIESVAGAEFEIKYFFERPFPTKHGVEAHIIIDGSEADCLLHSADSLLDSEGHKCEGAHTVERGRTLCSKFCFCDLKFEDGNACSVKKNERIGLGSVGTMKTEFIHLERMVRSRNPKDLSCALATKQGAVSEKEMKGQSVTHCASLRPATVSSSTYCDPVYTKAGRVPFATVNFKYRSLQSLKSMYIVPRTPSPVPLEERPAAELNAAELLELVNLMKERGAAAAEKVKKEAQAFVHVKREREDDDDEVTFVSKRKKNERKTPQKNDVVIELD